MAYRRSTIYFIPYGVLWIFTAALFVAVLVLPMKFIGLVDFVKWLFEISPNKDIVGSGKFPPIIHTQALCLDANSIKTPSGKTKDKRTTSARKNDIISHAS